MKRKHLVHKAKEKTPIRFKPQPTRNELCTCGSLKKYKKCCLLKSEIGEQRLIINANKKTW